MKRLTTPQFVKRAVAIHQNRYDYSTCEYVTSDTKVSIVCPSHGVFYQRPNRHLQGDGCPMCANNVRTSTAQFVEKAKRIHGSKYDYSQTVYKGNAHRLTIQCPLHGPFVIKANSHLVMKAGCKKCADVYQPTTKEFIDKAVTVHGDTYDYSNVKYVNNHTHVIIVCRRHGPFLQTPGDHLNSKAGCSRCVSPVSRMEKEWLDSLGVDARQAIIKHNNKTYVVDGYDAAANTVYEFYGDYWHGNPRKYNSTVYHPVISNFTYGQLYDKTIKRAEEIEKLGYNVVTMWELDYRKGDKHVNKR